RGLPFDERVSADLTAFQTDDEVCHCTPACSARNPSRQGPDRGIFRCYASKMHVRALVVVAPIVLGCGSSSGAASGDDGGGALPDATALDGGAGPGADGGTPPGVDGSTPPPGDAGSDAPASSDWLVVKGNKIVHADGTPFKGRGVNLHDERSC